MFAPKRRSAPSSFLMPPEIRSTPSSKLRLVWSSPSLIYWLFPTAVPRLRSVPACWSAGRWQGCGRATRLTGVSTGALMATLVFVGPGLDPVLEEAYSTVNSEDIYKSKGIKAVFSDSLYGYTPLKNKIDSIITEELLDRVAAEHRAGRRLYVATTNLGSGDLVVWDMGFIAASGHPRRLEIYQQVLRASAAVPELFKPVYIRPSGASKGRQMHVDGGAPKAPALPRSFMLGQPAVRRKRGI